MKPAHIYWLMGAAGLVIGYAILSSGSNIGAGAWAQSTLGRAYSAGADLAAP